MGNKNKRSKETTSKQEIIRYPSRWIPFWNRKKNIQSTRRVIYVRNFWIVYIARAWHIHRCHRWTVGTFFWNIFFFWTIISVCLCRPGRIQYMWKWMNKFNFNWKNSKETNPKRIKWFRQSFSIWRVEFVLWSHICFTPSHCGSFMLFRYFSFFFFFIWRLFSPNLHKLILIQTMVMAFESHLQLCFGRNFSDKTRTAWIDWLWANGVGRTELFSFAESIQFFNVKPENKCAPIFYNVQIE